MKPIYIKMSAFGSYAGEEIIDFRDVNNGIFLITGDTGAGKTTIFDAITYALYDETSGGKRNGEMMRSQYASDHVSTYVEFQFIYHGETYTIFRSPRQERRSKRRNKDGEYSMTMDQATVTLILPDGQEYKGGIRETNQAIVDIIGLDVNQFTQIAMIAQGDFLKLLHASSKERKEIFTKIFNTRIYWQIEEELKRRAKNIYGELEDNRKAIIRETEDIQCVDDSEYTQQWEDMPHFMESDSDKQLELIKLIIDEAKAKEDEIKKAQIKNEHELEEVNTKIKQAEDVNKLFVTLEMAIKKKEELDNKNDEMTLVRSQIDTGKKALAIEPKEVAFLNKKKELSECNHRIKDIKDWLEENHEKLDILGKEKDKWEEEYRRSSPKLISKISNIKELLPKYHELDTYNSERIILEKNRDKAQEEYDKVVELITETKNNKEIITGQQEELKKISDQYIQLTHAVEKLTERKGDLEVLLNSICRIKTLQSDYNNEKDKLKIAEEKYKTQKQHYDELYHSFIEGQAGILAATLEEGSPCPVCGSVSHPLKAASIDIVIDESRLQSAKNLMDEALNIRQERYEASQKAKQEYEKERELANHEGKRIIDTSFDHDNITVTDVQSILEECEKQLELKTGKRDQAKEAIEKFQSNQTQIKQLEESYESFMKEKDEVEKARQELASSLIETNIRIESLKKDLIYENKAHAQEELSATEKKLQSMEESRDKANEDYQATTTIINERRGHLKSEEDSLNRLTEEAKVLEEALYSEINRQGFIDVEEYRSALLSSEKIEELSLSLQSYREEVIENETNIKNYTEQLKGKSRIQTKELEEQASKLNDIKVQLEDESKAVYGIRRRDEEIYEKVTRLIREREKTKKIYGDISRLANTANGKLSGRRLNFQTYIQRRYFNMIIHEANKRLYTMSNNQFILKCRDLHDLSGQGEVGLDLDVYSMVNDQVRDVKTLSGGESFMAALSMALGMSDIIQNTAGRIHIDTMFIDEGFGSLSDDTRIQAINILNDLSGGNRLVGIISHVTELKAQIATKLLVTKGEKGSKARWEIS